MPDGSGGCVDQAAELASLFPRPVGAFVMPIEDGYPPFPEEAPAVARAVASRRIEFAAGRHCARRAMAALGLPPSALPAGPDRAPVWPPGLVGSITHSAGFCAAVVASSANFRSIGIDMLPRGAVSPALARRILRPDEIAGTEGPTLHFCLKEAAYKAFFPLYRRVIEFQDMRLQLDPDRHGFRAEAWPERRGTAIAFEGRYLIRQSRIHAACW